MGGFTNLSIEKKSVRHKLLIAFSLMSIIPLLSMAYFVTNYIFIAIAKEMVQVSIVVIFSLWISWMGYLLARTIIMPLIDMANEVKKIASGRYDSRISISREDELGDIANSINIMVAKIQKHGEGTDSREIVDRVTGLYTFPYLEECLQEEIKRAQYYQRPCSVLMLNIDNYKEYKEDNGEEAFEALLKEVAEVLVESVPPVGKVARNERDEFALLLPEKNKRESMEMAEEIRKRIGEINVPGEKVTVSIGVGENPIDGSDAKEVLFSTREYLEKAKRAGTNKIAGE